MRKIGSLAIVLCLLVMMAGCSTEKSNLEKLNDLDFTVVEEEDIPEEMTEEIKNSKDKPFKTTFADKGALYICEGYGEQATSGYSIEVAECYETSNAIYIHTNLLGPTGEEEVIEKTTTPYIVIKMEYKEKNVVFD